MTYVARPFGRAINRRWSQTARQPAATRSKWVRLPPASLKISTKFANLITHSMVNNATRTFGD
jgi:hypothetical protein